MYILDTSAVRGISRVKLEAAKKSLDPAISPLTFYELLCHLDEVDGDKTFARQKGHVMKCQIPRILHDPFAYHVITVGAVHVANPSRFEDPGIITQLMEKLGEAKSLDEFYSATVSYSDGTNAKCRDVVARVRKVLDAEEKKYIKHLGAIRSELLAIYSNCASTGITPQELGEYLAASLKTMIAGYRDKDGISDDCLEIKVVSSMYMHLGYDAVRTAKYLQVAHTQGCTFKPDPNDCEDSYIAIYLELFNRDVLVTEDLGSRNALNVTKEAFRLFFKGAFQIESQVISNKEFEDSIQN